MKAYFFDLDGTLADSRMGLYPAFRAALSHFGIPPVADEKLARFLGTPLPEMFRSYRPNLTDAEVEGGMQAFRAVYEQTGIEENELYPGAREMVTAATTHGLRVWVVTSKPEPQAKRVVSFLNLDSLVEGVIGASLAETDTKTELVKRALVAAKAASSEAVMVGDRRYDVTGALENNVLPLGALWGFGSRNELRQAGCRHFATSCDDLRIRFIETNAGLSDPRAAGRATAAARAARLL